MPILTNVGRKKPRQIAVRGLIYSLLTLGAAGIVIPMLIVLGQSVSDKFDGRDNAVVPRYLRDRGDLFLKYVFSFSPRINLAAARHRRDWENPYDMRADRGYNDAIPSILKAQGLNLDAWKPILSDLNAFKRTLDPDDLFPVYFRIEDSYRPFLKTHYAGKAAEFRAAWKRSGTLPAWFLAIFPEPGRRAHVLSSPDRLGVAIMNHELKGDYLNYYQLETFWPGNFEVPFWRGGDSPKETLWRDFKRTLPPDRLQIVASETYWHAFLRLKYRRLEPLNEAWGTHYASLFELAVPLAPPSEPAIRADWNEFIIRRWPRRLLEIPARYAPAWRAYVRRQLLAKVGARPDAEAEALREAARLAKQPVSRWEDLTLPARLPREETLARYWCEFTGSGAVPPNEMRLLAPELLFREFLKRKYGGDEAAGLKALNATWQTSFSSFSAVTLPLVLEDYVPVWQTPWKIRHEFITDAYCRAAQSMFGRSRAAWNTLVLVLLALASALTINPIAAYSLSRFPLKSTQKILIFFLATMAFPAEVAMIPNFLLLRDLHLLNTFAALVLPGMANGFAIFLLKGFFDSLPQELCEAAEMDGASEVQIFRMVALPLVKPILAFIGLSAFVAAYSSFMWAFVICPKEQMWTLMVWVYDFQSRNPGNHYVMAATVLLSLPPLIVFLFANRIIMRGIVIPQMK